MTRLVEHDATGPIRLDADDVDPEKGDIAVCLCGLSADYPFCDGSHRATEDEAPGELYRYEGDDDENPRHEVARVVFADEAGERGDDAAGDGHEGGASEHDATGDATDRAGDVGDHDATGDATDRAGGGSTTDRSDDFGDGGAD